MEKARKRGRGRYSVGGQQAEADPLLRESFYETTQYDEISSRDGIMSFVIGRTGSGKSAMLQRIEDENPKHVIRVTPEDLSLPYIAELGAVRHLEKNDVHLSPFFIALWKHIFLIEIIQHRYSMTSPSAKQNFLSTLMAKVSQDSSKLAALEYLNDFGDKFWCETDERVREITERFEQQVKAEGGISSDHMPIKAHVGSTGTRTVEDRTELIDRYQKIVNDTQLPRLNKMISVLDDDILDSPQHFTWLIIDDLDRDWVGDDIANDLILSLFRAVVDLKRVQNLKIIVALRTNIFQALDFANKKGGQEEKFRALTMSLKWTSTDIRGMLDERVAVATDKFSLTEPTSIKSLLPASNTRRGDPLEFILRRTLMRPRDAIAFVNLCLEASGGKPQITWDALNAAEPQYSQDRMLALRDEWKPSFPGLDNVMSVFAGAPPVISPEAFRRYLDSTTELLSMSDYIGQAWLMEKTKRVWDGSPDDGGLDPFRPLISLLFDIGFIGFRFATPKAVFSQDQPNLLLQPHSFSSIAGIVVHPAFWAALGIARRDDV